MWHLTSTTDITHFKHTVKSKREWWSAQNKNNIWQNWSNSSRKKHLGEAHYTTVDINKYGDIPQFDTSLLWPTHEIEIPLKTPPKGRPNQKRPLSSPDTTPNIVTKPRNKKAKKNLKAVSSPSDNGNNTLDDENTNTNEIARIYKIIINKRGKRSLSKDNTKKN